MSDKKFTPGPWEVDQLGIDFRIGVNGLNAIACGIARKANANLIATAPELLEELEKKCRHCQNLMWKMKMENTHEVCADCSTAKVIRKALGETK